MLIKNIHAQQQTSYKGRLQVQVQEREGAQPIPDATVEISYSGDPDSQIEELTTDLSGMSPTVELDAPPFEYSQAPSENQPYAQYTLRISAPGFEPVTIAGTEILPDVTALQDVRLRPLALPTGINTFMIPAHTLFGNYPPKIAEAEIKPVNQFGEIVLSRVVIPEYIVVHDGAPTDTTATDYFVRYRDYVKNVASCEIYATWPKETLVANILAIMSFTLNRVYTEWYRNKGFEFSITSSTAFDHKWVYGRNIFDSISETVDEVFSSYLARPNVKQPILTQYCDGQRVQCPNWMQQWGSRDLGDQGYNAIDIIRYYYGESMYINVAEEVAGVPLSWPGEALDIGSSGGNVRKIQEELNAISNNYPLLPRLAVDGIYGEDTANSVRVFQEIFSLPATGVVDFRTWYRIQELYVAVARLAELY